MHRLVCIIVNVKEQITHFLVSEMDGHACCVQEFRTHKFFVGRSILYIRAVMQTIKILSFEGFLGGQVCSY